MKTVIACVVATGMVVSPLVAQAGQSCGSGGGSDGGGVGGNSGGGGGGSTSDSSDSNGGGVAASEPPCIDDTDVVGYRQCTKYGAGWALHSRAPRIFLEVGSNVRNFDGGMSSARTGTVWHGAEQFMVRMSTPEGSAGRAAAVTSTFRVGAAIGKSMYAGIEGELGGMTSSPATAEMSNAGVFGMPDVDAQTPMVFGGAAIVGGRVSSGRASLAIEGAGGVRDVRYRYSSSYHNCEDMTIVDVVQPVLEARARAELWVNPWLTLGAQAGANVATRGDWMTGVFLGVHSRAFAGGR